MTSHVERVQSALSSSLGSDAAARLSVTTMALTAGSVTMLCCAGGGVLVQFVLGPAASAALNSGVLGVGGGSERCTEPAEEGAPKPSQKRRGRRKKVAYWLTAPPGELLQDATDRQRTRFGVDRVGLGSLAGLAPDAATVGAAAVVACGVGGRVAGSAAALAVVCVVGLRTKLVAEGVVMGDSNGLVAAFAPDLPAEVTALRVGRIELCLSSRLQLGVRIRDVTVTLAPYDLGSKALYYARLRRRIEAQARQANEVMRRQDALDAEQRFNTRQRNGWWLSRSPLGIYTVDLDTPWFSRGKSEEDDGVYGSVRRVNQRQSVALGWLGWKLRRWVSAAGVSMAVAAIVSSKVSALAGASQQDRRDTARATAKMVGYVGLVAVCFADSIVAAVLDRVYVEVDNIDLSLTDRQHTVRVACDEVRWQRVSKPMAVPRRTFWQRWVWSAYGPLPSVHGLSFSPLTVSVKTSAAGEEAAAAEPHATLTVSPLTLEVSAVMDHGGDRTSVDFGLPKLAWSSIGSHGLAARSVRSLRVEWERGSKVMQFGMQKLSSTPETALRRWKHAICSVLEACQRKAGKSTLAVALKQRSLNFSRRRACRLWSYALRCVKIQLLRAQYGRTKLEAAPAPTSAAMPRAPRTKGNARSRELEDLDLEDLRAQALAVGVEVSRLNLAEDGDSPEDAMIALLLGAEQSNSAIRFEHCVSVRIEALEGRFVETGEEETTLKFAAKALWATRTSKQALGSELPSKEGECSVGKLTCNWDAIRVLQTATHEATALTSNWLEVKSNSSLDLCARIGVLTIRLTPHVLNTIASLHYTTLDFRAPDFVTALVIPGPQYTSMFETDDVIQLYTLEEDTSGVQRETRRLRHRHRPQVDIKADMPVLNLGSDDRKAFLEIDLGRINAGNTSTELRSVLTGAARLVSTRYNAVGCKWDGASATFASKTSGGHQKVVKGFGGTVSVQVCALSSDHMWAQKCPQLQVTCQLRPFDAAATLSTLSGLTDLMSVMRAALADSGALDGARGDVVEVTPPHAIAFVSHQTSLYRMPEPPRWCLRLVDFEPREWTLSVLDEGSSTTALKVAFDVDNLRLQDYNTGHRNVDLTLKLHAYAYNAPVVAWEPVIEPWTAQLTSLQSGTETQVNFTGEQLNVNLSPSLARALGFGYQAPSRPDAPPPVGGARAEAWIFNCTGATLRHRSTRKVDKHNHPLPEEVRMSQQYSQLDEGADGPLDLIVPVEAGVTIEQGLVLQFPDRPWHDTQFSDVSREGVQSRALNGSMAGITVVCVTGIRDDGTRIVTLSSGVKVENQTARGLEFGVRRCDVAGDLNDEVETAMVVAGGSSGFFPAAMWAAPLHGKRSSQLVVFRTCDGGGDDAWTAPYDVQRPISAEAADLVVCNEFSEEEDLQFTVCLACTPGYAPAGKLSVLTLFNALDVLNNFAYPIELEFYEEEAAAAPASQPVVPCVAGSELTTSKRCIVVQPGVRVGVPEWNPKKDAWMAVSDCQGAISSRVCVYRASESEDQSLASDLALRGGTFATSSIRATDMSKLSTDKGMDYASCMPLSLQYAAQGTVPGPEGTSDSSHLVTVGCSYLLLNKTALPLVVRSRHSKRSDRDVVVELPPYDLDSGEPPVHVPFTSHGNVEVGLRVEEPSVRFPEDLGWDSMMLHIFCAKGLRGGLLDILTMDIPDPYLKVTFTPRRLADDSTQEKPKTVLGDAVDIGRTVALNDTADPMWNERFLLQVPSEGGVLTLKVMDYDRWSGDDSIGEVKLDIEHGNLIERGLVDVFGLGGIKKGHIELEVTKAAGCKPLVHLTVDTWGSRVVSTTQSGAQLLPVSLGLDDLGVTMAPLDRTPGAPQTITIAPRYRLDNFSPYDLMVAAGTVKGHTLEVEAGECRGIFGLTSGDEQALFFRAEQLDDEWSAWSRKFVVDEGHCDPTVDSTRITCGAEINLNVTYEILGGVGVVTVRPGTPAIVVQNLAVDCIWVARDYASEVKSKKQRYATKGKIKQRFGEKKVEWVRLSRTESHSFWEWDWHREGKIKLKTWDDETRTIDVSTLTDVTSQGWSWSTSSGETVWPQVLVLNNTRVLRLGKTAVRPRDDDIESVFKLEASVPGVGLSVIGDASLGQASELLYASLHHLSLHQKEIDGKTTTDFSVGKFQVDEYMSESDRPNQRGMIAGPKIAGQQVKHASMLHVHAERVYQPGPALFEVLSVKTQPMFLNLKWPTVSRLLRERSLQQLFSAMLFNDWATTAPARIANQKPLLHSVQVDPLSLSVKFHMAGCMRDNKLLEVLGLERYAEHLHTAAEQDTGAIRTQRLNLNNVFYSPSQVFYDATNDLCSLVATRLMSSTNAAVQPVESVLSAHQRSGSSKKLKRSKVYNMGGALVKATEPPLLQVMDMVSKVTDTAPGRQHRNLQSSKTTRSDELLFAARWPRVFGGNGVLKTYSVNDIVLWRLLRKSGCCEGRELDERCLGLVAVAEPENPASRSLMLLTEHTIFFAKAITYAHTVQRRVENFQDIGSLEIVFGEEIAVCDIRSVEMDLKDGELFLRLSGCERLFTTNAGDLDVPLETEHKLAEFFDRLVKLLETIRTDEEHQRRFTDSMHAPPLKSRKSFSGSRRFDSKARDHGVGKGAATVGTVTLVIHDAGWDNPCLHGRHHKVCKDCKRQRLDRPEKPGPEDWFCELQVGKNKPRRLDVDEDVKFDVGGGPRCVVVLKNSAVIGDKCIGVTELRVDSNSLGEEPEARWFSVTPLPGSAETPGARVKMSVSCAPRVEESIMPSARSQLANGTAMRHSYATCTVLKVDIATIRPPAMVQLIHGEKLTCALELFHDDILYEEKDTFVLVSSTDESTVAHGLEPVLFDLTEMKQSTGRGRSSQTFVLAKLLSGDQQTLCTEKFVFPGPQVGWAKLHDPTMFDEEDDSSIKLRRQGDIDVSMSVDAVRESWNHPDLAKMPSLVEYQVTLRTGTHEFAATTASIFVQLIGDRAHSPRIPLQLSEEELRMGGIEKGRTTVCTIMAPKVGKLQRLRIGHDNTGTAAFGKSQAWLLESAAVKRLPPTMDDLVSSGSDDEPEDEDEAVDGVVFPCGEWFGRPTAVPTSGLTSSAAKVKNLGFKGSPLVYTGDVALTRELLAKTMNPTRLLDTYTVTVSTGCVGTDGSVTITLFGLDGDSGAHELRHRGEKRRAFSAGAIETFTLDDSFALGHLRYVSLELNAVDHHKQTILPELFSAPKPGPNMKDARTVAIEKQLAAGWMCEHVTIQNVRTMQRWSLPVQCMLATESSSGGTAGLSRMLELGPPKQVAVYRVTTVTGDVLGAGTDAGVSLRMVGLDGQSDLLKLKRKPEQSAAIVARGGSVDPFERGQTDEFELEIDDVGVISHIELSHDGRGAGNGWFVDEVLVERLGATVEAAKVAAKAPTFGKPKKVSTFGKDRMHMMAAQDGSSHRRGGSGDSGSPETGERAGRRTHPLAHHRHAGAASGGGRGGGGRGGGSSFGRSVALEHEQTRFVLGKWVEDKPVEMQVRLDDLDRLAAGRHSACWLVTVKTGAMEYAATTSGVSIALRGTSGDGGTHRLDISNARHKPQKGPFVRGAESVFTLRTAELGLLSELTVSHDNSGMTTERAAWFLEWIEVIDEGTGEHFHFPCGQWLGGGRSRLESTQEFEERCAGILNDGALFRVLTPLPAGEQRRDPVRRVLEEAEDTLGTLVVKRLTVLDNKKAIHTALSRKHTYMRLSCGGGRSKSTIATSVHGSRKGLSNARAAATWGEFETLRLRVGNCGYGKAEMKLVAMGKDKTLGMESTSLVMEGMDRPVVLGEAAINLKDAFPEAFDDRSQFISVGGVHHAVYELKTPGKEGEEASGAVPPLRVEVLAMFLPNRSRSQVEWSRKSNAAQLRHSVPDLQEEYDDDDDDFEDPPEAAPLAAEKF